MCSCWLGAYVTVKIVFILRQILLLEPVGQGAHLFSPTGGAEEMIGSANFVTRRFVHCQAFKCSVDGKQRYKLGILQSTRLWATSTNPETG